MEMFTSVMKIHYCKSWFSARKIPLDSINEGEARALHEGEKPYTALIGDELKPSCFVEMVIDKGMVGVGFLDDLLREYLTYQFQVTEDGRLFLSMATHREYDGNDDRVVKGTSYLFEESGKLAIEREAFDPYQMEEAHSEFDPSGNYEEIPSFGDYSKLISRER
ncbi:hypothetical protein NTJ56_10160 [Burkholderia contaminans]|uniref:hypothetical protein n=1 Tax=Burkholderia contaminans TaxID=488447 RepID=UPI001CF4E1AD|nr:hypothetical protein [Burkholderia contaminans]MCA7918743.1 hypothetical protein [Burkholderia contaminans]UUX35739.1 hypothetical protein NTJ56_10160 [Burkholderia contaminans]